ncbi:MAG TPA: hypothetical protein VGG02_14135 [Chthoniobacterales bacterium]|jgi:uncharacterized protein YcfJ
MDEKTKAHENRDPVTGEPGSHPVGTGVGTAGGAAAGGAIGAAVGGPVGAVAGAIIGGVAGAYSGRGVAEAVNPTVEEQYWRENHAAQSYATAEHTYEHFAPAYRVGYEAVAKYPGKDFDEIDDDLALDYQKYQPGSALPWDQVRPATRAAWNKVSGTISGRDPTRGIRGSI